MLYLEALRKLWGEGYTLVQTNAYDQEIGDHIAESEGDETEVNIDRRPDGSVWLVRVRPDGYLDTAEPWAICYRE